MSSDTLIVSIGGISLVLCFARKCRLGDDQASRKLRWKRSISKEPGGRLGCQWHNSRRLLSGMSSVDLRAASHDDRSGQGEQRRILHDILHQSLLLIRRSFDAGSPTLFLARLYRARTNRAAALWSQSLAIRSRINYL